MITPDAAARINRTISPRGQFRSIRVRIQRTFFFFIQCIFIIVALFYFSVSLPRFFSSSFYLRSRVTKRAFLPPPSSPLRHVPLLLSREGFSPFFPCRLASKFAYPLCTDTIHVRHLFPLTPQRDHNYTITAICERKRRR